MKSFLGYSPIAVTTSLLAVVLASGAVSAPRAGATAVSFGTIEVTPVATSSATSDPRVRRVRTDVRITIDGDQRVARFEVEEQFRNDWHRMMEGDYLYPIPAGAVFTDFSLFMGEQELKGEMLPAATARGIYEEIVRRKKDPALIELIGHGVLRARVFPINPGETRRIILRYTQVLGRDGNLLRLRYPRVAGLFDAGDEGPTPRDAQVFEATAHLTRPPRQPGSVPFTMTINVTDAERFASPYSPSHRIEVRERSADEIEITYAGSGEMPRDFDLFLPLREDVVGAGVVTHAPIGEPGFYMMLLSPPAEAAKIAIARDVTLVLDVSGSMSGDKIEQARAAMDQILAGLGEDDRFRIITFSSVVRQFRRGWTAADRGSVGDARAWLATVDADGSTNIQAALREALAEETSRGRMAQVVFLTDGKPTVGETSVENIVELAGSMLAGERLFAFGVGHDVNTYLLDSLTEGAHGTVSYVGPGEDVEQAVSSLTRKISFPALADLRIIESPVMLEDGYPQELPDLFYGEDLVLFGRYRGSGSGRLVLEGSRAGETQRFTFDVSFADRDDGNGFIPKLWASRKAGVLTRQVRLHGANSELVEEIRQLGLRYGVLTDYTSYLVEEPNMSLDDATMQEVMNRAQQMEVAADLQVGATAFRRAERDRKAASASSVEEAEQSIRQYAMRLRPASESPAAPGTVNGSIAASGDLRADGPGGRDNSGLAGGYDTAPRHVVDRLFVARNGVWTDLRFADERVVKVVPYSAAYFELIERLPLLKPFFSLGDRVIIAGDGLAVALSETGVTIWTSSQLNEVVDAFGQ